MLEAHVESGYHHKNVHYLSAPQNTSRLKLPLVATSGSILYKFVCFVLQ